MANLVLSESQLVSIRKGLIEGLTIASGSKSSATYYHSKDEQIAAIKKSVHDLYNLSKELPLILANQDGATGKFVSEVLLNELKKGFNGGSCNIVNPIDWYDNNISEKAVLNALYKLGADNGITYVLRLFMNIKEDKINNKRTRKTILWYIYSQNNIEFYAVKYRNKLSAALKHAYGVQNTLKLLDIAKTYVKSSVYETDEKRKFAYRMYLRYLGGMFDDITAFKLLLFIFKKLSKSNKPLKSELPFVYEYYVAKKDITKVKNLPEEVVLGIIADKKHPQYDELWSTEAKRKMAKRIIRENVKVTSVNQQMRQTKSNKNLGVKKTVDTNKVTDYLALYKTGYENGFTTELWDAIDKFAEKKKIKDFPYENIGIVLDVSKSMEGHVVESKNTPKAIANFTAKVLEKSAKRVITAKTDGDFTDLSTAFVKLLKNEDQINNFDAIYIITDGYENMYDGLTNEVIDVYLKESGRYIPIYQISPITGAEVGSNVRKISNDVTTLAINNPSVLKLQMEAKLLESDPKKWLEFRVNEIENKNISRKIRELV